MSLQTGDIVFFSGNDIYSKLIKWFTNSEISHVGIISAVFEEYVLIAEALNKGFVLNKYHKVYVDTLTVGRIYPTLNKHQRKKMRNLIVKNVGKKYDWEAIFILFKKYLGLKVNFNDANRLMCSEAVARIYSDFGIKFLDIEDNLITPEDIYLYCIESELIINDGLKLYNLR